MKKSKLYLETSVWNFLIVDDSPEKREATICLFAEIKSGNYDVFISDVVVNEIMNAPVDRKDRLAQEIEKIRPVQLYDSQESQILVSNYLANGLLSDNHIADLAHLSTASVNGMDILVSWNMKHLVKHRTRTMACAINRLYGYNELDICTPEEVIEYGQ